jgi:hypothetical protein
MTVPVNDTATWILAAVVALLGVILWWSIRGWIKGVNSRIAEILSSLQVMGNKNIGFEKDIARLDRTSESFDKRMHDYSERIRTIETTQARCRNCN